MIVDHFALQKPRASGDLPNGFPAFCTQFPSHRQAARGTGCGGFATVIKPTICGILIGSLLDQFFLDNYGMTAK